MKNKKALVKKPNKFLKVLKWIGLSIVALILIGFIYEQISEFIDAKTLKAPGQMIQVGDHKMHIYCTGENKNGSPTVILEAGGGASFAEWGNIQPELSVYTKICSYDRSGYGFSENTTDGRTNIDVSKELELLLKNANIPGPYILVGHSIGGYYTRVFASSHMGEVKGLVFLDCSHEGQATAADFNNVSFFDKFMEQITNNAIRLGIARLILTVDPSFAPMPKENLRYNIYSLIKNTLHYQNKVDDIEGAMLSDSQVAAARNFGNIPIRVLTADSSVANPNLGEKWLNWQKDLATLSTNGTQVTVANTSHFIPVDQPQAVINAIKELLQSAN
jgi:pimeloyl-ACP methyl ester carboxylesterase